MQLMQLMYRIPVIQNRKARKEREKTTRFKAMQGEMAGELSGSAKATGAVCM